MNERSFILGIHQTCMHFHGIQREHYVYTRESFFFKIFSAINSYVLIYRGIITPRMVAYYWQSSNVTVVSTNFCGQCHSQELCTDRDAQAKNMSKDDIWYQQTSKNSYLLSILSYWGFRGEIILNTIKKYRHFHGKNRYVLRPQNLNCLTFFNIL